MKIDIILNEFATPQEAAELSALAESYGIRGVWSSSYADGRDPFFVLALAANQTDAIQLGPLAVSPYELHPLKMANVHFSLLQMIKILEIAFSLNHLPTGLKTEILDITQYYEGQRPIYAYIIMI